VAVAALAVSSHSSWGQTKQAAIPSTLEGTWIGTLTVTGATLPTGVKLPPAALPPPSQGLHTFTSNGGLISTGALTPGTQQGTWIQTGDRTFNLTGVSFSFDSKDQPAGMAKESETITVNETFDAFTGIGKDDVFDAAGKLMFTGTATLQGTRLRVEPAQ
jgi:hypothetical protein